MKEKLRNAIGSKVRFRLQAEQRLELQISLVILLLLATMAVMDGYMDQFQSSGETSEAAGQLISSSTHPGIIRFHILANSDSQEDQDLKLEVRNQVMSRIQAELMETFSREMNQTQALQMEESRRLELTRTWIEGHLDEIEGWAETAAEEAGHPYEVTAEIGMTWIPEREYDGMYFPEGMYEALNLTIGEGEGHNWWCVIFPPLCLIDGRPEQLKAMGEDRMRAVLATLGGDRIVLKSRILELLNE